MPSDTPLVAAVSPKLPEFWPQAADVWLAQAEAQFRLAKVTVSQTKFDLAVQRLDRDTALRLQDVLLTTLGTALEGAPHRWFHQVHLPTPGGI